MENLFAVKPKHKMGKKGFQVGDLLPLGFILGILAVGLGLMATLLTDVQSDQTSGSYAYNVSGFGLEGLNTLSKWIPTIALVVVIAVIVGIIIFYLVRQFNKTR